MSALEEAMRVSLIEEMKGGREARYRFTHAFFRQTLYEEMIAPRRLRMHNEVAKALEQHYAGRVEDHAAELAEHYAHSSSEEDLRLAVAYGELAAGRAASVYAFGEAARLVEQAIQVQEIVEPADAETLYRLMLTLSACLLAAGETERVINETMKRGLELAEKLGGGKLACDITEVAAFAFIYKHGLTAFVMPEYAALCDVLERHAAPGTGEQARALLWRSWIAYVGKDPKATWPPRREALELARTLGDRVTLVNALFAFTVTGNPMGWDEDKLVSRGGERLRHGDSGTPAACRSWDRLPLAFVGRCCGASRCALRWRRDTAWCLGGTDIRPGCDRTCGRAAVRSATRSVYQMISNSAAIGATSNSADASAFRPGAASSAWCTGGGRQLAE
jgi:hypothetical protein